MARRLIQISLVATFNRVVNFVNNVQERGIDIGNMGIIDIKFQMISAHIEAIANRAIELNDPVLLERLNALGVLSGFSESSSEELPGIPASPNEGHQETPAT